MNQLTRNAGDDHQASSEASLPIISSTTEASTLRFRKGHSLTWSFVPISADPDPLDSIATNARRLRSVALFIWLHSGPTDHDPEAAAVTQMCDGNWLHIFLNDGVSPRASTMTRVYEELREVIDLLRETYSIDSNCVYLASTSVGTDNALRLLLMRPDRFRGIALLTPQLTFMPELIDSDDRLKQVRALLVHTVDREAPIREMFTFGRLLHSAGMRLTTHFCLPNRLTLGRLFIDWINKEQPMEAEWSCHW